MQEGMNIDLGILVTVLENKLAQAVVREAQMEAAIQGLLKQMPNNTPMQPGEEVEEDVTGTDD